MTLLSETLRFNIRVEIDHDGRSDDRLNHFTVNTREFFELFGCFVNVLLLLNFIFYFHSSVLLENSILRVSTLPGLVAFGVYSGPQDKGNLL